MAYSSVFPSFFLSVHSQTLEVLCPIHCIVATCTEEIPTTSSAFLGKVTHKREWEKGDSMLNPVSKRRQLPGGKSSAIVSRVRNTPSGHEMISS